MSNKMGGILILFGIISLILAFYWYFFIYSLINITFQSNISEYSISLDSRQKEYQQNCPEKKCIIPRISPFEYNVKIEKEGYKTLEFTYKPTKSNNIKNIILEKKYELEKVELFSQKEAKKFLENQNKKLNLEEKIEKIKSQQKIFYTIKTEKNIYTFKNKGDKLELFQNNIYLGTFQAVKSSEIKLLEVVGNKDYLFLELGEKKYLFSIKNGKKSEIILKIPIKYIKVGDKNGFFIFVTDRGSFEYNIYKNIFSYNSFFSDYIIFDKNTYIGIIYTNDFEKKDKFGLRNITRNIILQYNPKTKEQKILLETTKNITQIFKKNGKIYIQDKNKNYFSITQLEEKY